MPFKVHDVDVWLHPTPFYKNLTSLQNKGYSIDFASDKMLSEASANNGVLTVAANGAAHKVLLVSKTHVMPVATLQNIIRLAKAGATVIMEDFPEDVPGLDNLEARRKELKALMASVKTEKKSNDISVASCGKGKIILSMDVAKALQFAGIERESLVDSGLKFIRRSINNGKYYYIVNHTSSAVNTTLPLQFAASSVVIMDPQTGATGTAATSQIKSATNVRLQIQPGEALILKATTDANKGLSKWNYVEPTGSAITLNNEWKLHFVAGGPQIPSDKTMRQLRPWTSFTNDTTTQNFSGTAIYSTTFNLPVKQASDYILQLGKVDESARVFINGKEVGLLWSIPFQARVGQYLKQGENTISIEVANLMANRIRYMDRNEITWRKYHEINFVDINYKNFDASKWKVQPSGLEGPVTITPVSYK
jgi:hypothetical protein